jgi:hypothetical protein
MKNRFFSNILYALPDDDPLRIETCSNAECNLVNGVVFDRSACTVVLFTLLLAVTERNLQRRLDMFLATAHHVLEKLIAW